MARGEKRKAFWKKLNNPFNWVSILAYVVTLILCPLAFYAIIVDHGHNVYAVVAGCLSGIPLLYTLYILVITCIRLVKKLIRAADKFTFTRNLFKSYEFRSIFFGACSLVFNVGYTVFLCVTAIVYQSSWYGAMALYYILLSLARGGILIQNTKDERKYRYHFFALHKAKAGTYRYCGVMMITLALALSLSVVQMFADGAVAYIPKWAIFAFAAFTLYRVITAIYHFVKSSKKDDLVVRAVRYINLTTALVSVLTLQTAILAAFKPPFNASYANAITGSLVCLVTMALGIFMISFSFAVRKKLAEQEAKEPKEKDEEYGYNREEYVEEYGSMEELAETLLFEQENKIE